jgi:hypothetical protein
MSIRAVAAIVAVIVAHYVWFQYFVKLPEAQDMLQLFGFFIFFVWSVPCALLVSLSINDNILPGIGPSNPYGTGLHGDGNVSGGKRRSMFKIIADFAYDGFIQVSSKIGPFNPAQFVEQSFSSVAGKQSGKKMY